jgi:hypothetical protein
MAVRQKRAIMKKHGLLTEEDRYRDRGVQLVLNGIAIQTWAFRDTLLVGPARLSARRWFLLTTDQVVLRGSGGIPLTQVV